VGVSLLLSVEENERKFREFCLKIKRKCRSIVH
jgi:hypothetical protein